VRDRPDLPLVHVMNLNYVSFLVVLVLNVFAVYLNCFLRAKVFVQNSITTRAWIATTDYLSVKLPIRGGDCFRQIHHHLHLHQSYLSGCYCSAITQEVEILLP
jgi:hypothetical protein